MKIPETVEGIDVSPNLKETGNVEVPPDFIHGYPGRDVFLNNFRKHNMDPLSKGWRGLRSEKHTYVIHKGYWPDEDIDERYLYNLEKDPYQLNAIEITDINKNEVALKLHKQLKAKLEKLGDPFDL